VPAQKVYVQLVLNLKLVLCEKWGKIKMVNLQLVAMNFWKITVDFKNLP